MLQGDRGTTSDRIAAYYTHLFSFPSLGAMVVVTSLVTLFGGAFAPLLLDGWQGLSHGLETSFLVFTFSTLLSAFIARACLGNEPMFSLRRCLALSFSVASSWIFVFFVGSVLNRMITGCIDFSESLLIGSLVASAFRSVLILALSAGGVWITWVLSILQPVCGVLCYWLVSHFAFYYLVADLVLCSVTFVVAWTTLRSIEAWPDGWTSPKFVPLFRAFLLAWTEGINEPLEDHLDQIGAEADLPVGWITFNGRSGASSGLLVSNIHPGPFRNIGSSALPQILYEKLEKSSGAHFLFLHGISSHEEDLTRQTECSIVAAEVASSLLAGSETRIASHVVSVQKGAATATSQIIGEIGLVTLTLAPKSFEDLPREVEDRIVSKAHDLGVTPFVVDLHNSIDGHHDVDAQDVNDLCEAATESLDRATASPRAPFRVGYSRIRPNDFRIEDGMGLVGMAAVTLYVPGQSRAFVVIDGNNMITGLREHLISTIKTLGFDNVEVGTTDTHAVNGLRTGTRGYYPFGEKISWGLIDAHLKTVVSEAETNKEPVTARWGLVKVKGLKVLGKDGLAFLEHSLELGINRLKRGVLALLIPSLALSSAVILLL